MFNLYRELVWYRSKAKSLENALDHLTRWCSAEELESLEMALNDAYDAIEWLEAELY